MSRCWKSFWKLFIVLAIVIFSIGFIGSSYSFVPYDRDSQYGDWIDADGDCLNTRHEVLQQESLMPAIIEDCKVIFGLWYDPYTAKTFNDPSELDVDHMVPLKEAHISGAYAWTDEQRRAFANDLDNPGHLIAVQARANRVKGAKDPSEWLPPNEAFHCAYVKTWIGIKLKWNLSVDEEEHRTVADILINKC